MPRPLPTPLAAPLTAASACHLVHNNAVAVIVPCGPNTRQHLPAPFCLSLIGGLADALTGRGHDMLPTTLAVGGISGAAHAA